MRAIDADVLKQHIDKLPALPDGNFAGNHSALKALINMQPTIQPEPHWIPVTERLPAMGKSVLMCDIDGDIYLGHRTQCGYYYPDFCDDKIKDVRAWCELPEPYKEVTT